jgi:hypothetical protein
MGDITVSPSRSICDDERENAFGDDSEKYLLSVSRPPVDPLLVTPLLLLDREVGCSLPPAADEDDGDADMSIDL